MDEASPETWKSFEEFMAGVTAAIELYDERNRVIHRYIISRITTADVLDIAVRYEAMHKGLMKRLHAIEERQIRMGVGITVRGPELKGEEGRCFLDEIADDKHTPSLARLLRGG